MSENYIMLNGKRVDLTDEQIEKLGIKIKKDCFERQDKGFSYYFTNYRGYVYKETDDASSVDDDCYKVANYCTDEKLMEQRVLHETLDRLLWRFSMQNDGDKIRWNVGKNNYFIVYNHSAQEFEVDCFCILQANIVHFYTKEIAKRAINEIILPFMKEHPEFVW